jgi:hypothetical protein
MKLMQADRVNAEGLSSRRSTLLSAHRDVTDAVLVAVRDDVPQLFRAKHGPSGVGRRRDQQPIQLTPTCLVEYLPCRLESRLRAHGDLYCLRIPSSLAHIAIEKPYTRTYGYVRFCRAHQSPTSTRHSSVRACHRNVTSIPSTRRMLR